ncbi:MAG: methyl-coenzyme M reductase-associated protein Mmp3 [Candidatus Alkanophagales archaeon]
MKVVLDGEEVEAEPGTTVGELLRSLGRSVAEGMLVAVRRGERELEARRFVFDTDVGVFVCEIDLKEWAAQHKAWEGAAVAWVEDNKVVIGPVRFDVRMRETAGEVRRKKGDVFILKSSPTAEDAFLCIALSEHKELSLLPEGAAEDGRIGRVVMGFSVVRRLSKGVRIRGVEAERRAERVVEKITLGTAVKENMNIFTRLKVKLSKEAKVSAEALFSYLKFRNNVFVVDEATRTYLRAETPLALFDLVPENNEEYRRRGTVCIRNEGERVGSIYIYKEDRMPNPALNKIGVVEVGAELLDVAGVGDRILVETEPKHVFVLGMTQKDAESALEELGLSQERAGDTRDDAIVVAQHPNYTLEAYERGVVRTEGVPADSIVYVELFEREAPNSVDYFRNATGLYRNFPIGKLSIIASTDSMILFRGAERKRAIIPENTPAGKVEAGTIGVTNMSRPGYGMIGIRLEESDQYGPTGEPFESTNIIGVVRRGLENLRGKKRGDVWLIEMT